MKAFLVVLALTVAVGAQGQRKSLKEWKGMGPLQRLAHVRDNCPENKDISDEEITTNLALNIDAGTAVQNMEFETGVTCMSARSPASFKGLQTLVVPEQAKNRPESDAPSRRRRQTVPATYDARTTGLVGPVLNQGNCGSCWTFSATGAMEGAIKKKTGTLPSMSQQNLVDCVTASNGCNGGWMTDAYNYNKANKGSDNATVYPYLATKQTTCKYTTNGNVLPNMTSFAYTKQGDEADLKIQLYTRGVIAVAIQAGDTAFGNYVGGIYSCPSFTAVDHGVLLVGYGTDAATNTTAAQDFWLLKNSWGTGWGEQGYFRIVRNKGTNSSCGIPQYANFPLI